MYVMLVFLKYYCYYYYLILCQILKLSLALKVGILILTKKKCPLGQNMFELLSYQCFTLFPRQYVVAILCYCNFKLYLLIFLPTNLLDCSLRMLYFHMLIFVLS